MSIQHRTVYREPGRFAGWPANYGLWSCGDEIVVGFTLGYMDLAGGFHACDHSRPFTTMQARSLDGGHTWDVRPAPLDAPGGRGLSADEHMRPELRIGALLEAEDAIPPCPGGLDFTHPDFALMCGRSGLRAGARSWFYVSSDRCHTWRGPYALPMFGLTGLSTRTDYLVSSASECLLFLTAAKSNGQEGQVFCARTVDGGETFSLVARVGPEPEGYTIMPASVRLDDGRILTAVRCQGPAPEGEGKVNWIDLYTSADDGATWRCVCRPAPDTGGNPPSLTRLHDGRLCLIHGYRRQPCGIHARLSSDDGATWSAPIVLRDDAGSPDMGYPRTALRADGTLVTVYYYNDDPEGERYIGATLWKP